MKKISSNRKEKFIYLTLKTIDMSSKDFDLIVFGATSFTGKLVVEYLDKNYKDNISWALAGRNKEKLEAVKEQLSCDAPILIIDSESQNDIQNALSKTKLVITTVGPYQLYGNLLIEMCAKLGVDYVDLCGEPGWMYEMQKFIPETKKSGSRIVHSCGYVLHSIGFRGFLHAKSSSRKVW